MATELHRQVPTEITTWPIHCPRRISVNNFGYGGANAHLILESLEDNLRSWPGQHAHVNGSGALTREPSRVYIVSAKDPSTTKALCLQLAAYIRDRLNTERELSTESLCYTLGQRRSRFQYRRTVLASDLEELKDKLEEPFDQVSASSRTRIGFVFSGQGAQWCGMGRELISSYPSFKAAVEKADDILRALGACWSLQGQLYSIRTGSAFAWLTFVQMSSFEKKRTVEFLTLTSANL